MGRLPGCCSGILVLVLLSSEVQGDCPAPPNPPNATLKTEDPKDSYPPGTILRYVCVPGYQKIAGTKPIIRCRPSSKWSPVSTFCERKPCKRPEMVFGAVQGPDYPRLGDEVTFSCYHGYRLKGQKTSRCILKKNNKVEWNLVTPRCERIPCPPPPDIVNGENNAYPSMTDYPYGTVVTYTCNKNYSLIGQARIHCSVDISGKRGKWSYPAPECKVVRCDRPEIPNGNITTAFRPTYTYDNVIYFECDAGYVLVGHESVKCRADNSWHPKPPSCVKGNFTATSTTTTTRGGEGGGGGDDGPPVGPASEATEEAITNEAGATQSPGGADPSVESGDSKTAAIVFGVLLSLLPVVATILAFVIFRRHGTEGKSDSQPGTSHSSRAASHHKMKENRSLSRKSDSQPGTSHSSRAATRHEIEMKAKRSSIRS